MPLKKGCGRTVVSRNISTEVRHGRPQRQAVAIALNTARRSGCDVPGPGFAAGSGAIRYSGELVLRLSWKERPGPNGTYVVHISRKFEQGTRKMSTQYVGAPASLTHAVDSPKAYDDAARAAISFADDDPKTGSTPGEYAATDPNGSWHIGRTAATKWPAGSAGGSAAVRYSGELVMRVSWKERPGPNGTYVVHISRGGKKLGTQHVGAPASLSHAVDSSKAYDEAAHAAISFSDGDVQEHAVMGPSGHWHIGRSIETKWPKAGLSAGMSTSGALMPPLSKWDTFAGGTSAPSNSNSYSITFNGRKYMISPLGARHNSERLAGYVLDVFPGEHHGWTRIGHFSRAASAAKAARIYAADKH